MCIAILKTKKGNITDEALRNSFKSNKDGAGIAYTVNKQLVIEKGIFNEDEFISKVRNAEKICDNNMLIHCRIGTSGDMNAYCTHPFIVRKNVCLIHNGILDIEVPKSSKENDTQIFIKEYLYNINETALMHDKNLHKIIENIIGYGNKFVLLDNKGYYKIINEEAGDWVDNVWYSNDSYKYKPVIYNWENCYYKYYDDDYTGDYNPDDKIQNKILKVIDNLEENDLANLGYYPIYDYGNNQLINETEFFSRIDNGYKCEDYKYLQDIGLDIYNYYLDTVEYIEELKEYNKEEDFDEDYQQL